MSKEYPEYFYIDIRCPRDFFEEAMHVANKFRGTLNNGFEGFTLGYSGTYWTPYRTSMFQLKHRWIRWFISFERNGTYSVEFINIVRNKGDME